MFGHHCALHKPNRLCVSFGEFLLNVSLRGMRHDVLALASSRGVRMCSSRRRLHQGAETNGRGCFQRTQAIQRGRHVRLLLFLPIFLGFAPLFAFPKFLAFATAHPSCGLVLQPIRTLTTSGGDRGDQQGPWPP